MASRDLYRRVCHLGFHGIATRHSPFASRRHNAYQVLSRHTPTSHIDRVPPNQPPYAVPPTEFRFPALAALAGRAQLGGDREVALALFVAARLAQDCQTAGGLSDASRAERAASAKTWMSTFALPAAVKAVIAKLMEATAGDLSTIADDLRAVVASARVYLDIQSQAELERLATSLSAGTSVTAR